MPFYTFVIRVKHDAGFRTIRTLARSKAAAIHIVCAAERCPERAIREVRCINGRGFELATEGERAGELVRLSIAATALKQDIACPANPYRSGYGARIPTPYRVRTIDNQWRRVYCAQYSNAGTVYVLHRGIKTIVDLPI